MKALYFSFLLLLPLLAWSQIFRVDPHTHKVTYSEVTEVEGAPKAELYDRARQWFDLQYAHTENVTMTEYKEAGELHIEAEVPVTVGLTRGTVSYTLVVAVRDHRYRFTLTNFFFRHPNRQPVAFENGRLHPQMRIFAKTDEKVQVLLAGLHQKMVRKETALVDDW